MRARIDPGTAPGGLVFRITRADGTVVWFEPIPDMDDLTNDDLAACTDRHRTVAQENSLPGAPSVLRVFDGDTGECTAAFMIIYNELAH